MTDTTSKTAKSEMFILLDRVNQKSIRKNEFDLNNAPCYGGWQLTSNNGSTIFKHRVSLKEMKCFLDGMSKALDFWADASTNVRLKSNH